MQRPHGPFAIRLVGFYDHPNAPLQINVVCTHCLCMSAFYHPADLHHFTDQDCPKTVISSPELTSTGEFNYARLCEELEKRRQL